MPFDPSGNFTRVMNWQQDRDNGIRILADRHDAEDDNFAAAFNQVFLRGGIVPMTGDLNMGGFNINTIKAGSAAAPSLTWELSPNTGLFQPNPTSLAFSSNGVEKVQMNGNGMSITGSLGIGAAAPPVAANAIQIYNFSTIGVAGALMETTATDNRALVSVKVVAVSGTLQAFGSAYPTVSGIIGPNTVVLNSTGTGGLGLLAAAGPVLFATGAANTERMRIQSSGNVGIGIAAPLAPLHVAGAAVGGGLSDALTIHNAGFGDGTLTRMFFRAGDTNYASISGGYVNGARINFNVLAGGAFVWAHEAVERMKLNIDGNLGVGTSTPSNKLVVADASGVGIEFAPNAPAGNNAIYSYDRVAVAYRPLMIDTGGLTLAVSASPVLRINTAGNVSLGVTSTGFGTQLHVADLIAAPATWDASKALSIGESSGNTGYRLAMGTYLDAGVWTGFIQNIAASVPANLVLNPGGGNLGIGVVAPTQKLDVNGSALFRGQIRVAVDGTFFDIAGPAGTHRAIMFHDGAAFLIRNDIVTGYTNIIQAGNNPIVFSPNSVETVRIDSATIRPSADATINCGIAAFRWKEVFAAVGTINTSDAREKSPLAPLTANELAAARVISQRIGTYTWLDKDTYDDKKHVGVTAQAVIEVMAAHGLDALDYGFVRYDEWEAIPAVEAVEGSDAVIDKDGKLIKEAVQQVTGVPGREAGNRYSVSYTELAMFLAASQEQLLVVQDRRLAALEARTAPAPVARRVRRKAGEL